MDTYDLYNKANAAGTRGPNSAQCWQRGHAQLGADVVVEQSSNILLYLMVRVFTNGRQIFPKLEPKVLLACFLSSSVFFRRPTATVVSDQIYVAGAASVPAAQKFICFLHRYYQPYPESPVTYLAHHSSARVNCHFLVLERMFEQAALRAQ
jgi:hypothetical protein